MNIIIFFLNFGFAIGIAYVANKNGRRHAIHQILMELLKRRNLATKNKNIGGDVTENLRLEGEIRAYNNLIGTNKQFPE